MNSRRVFYSESVRIDSIVESVLFVGAVDGVRLGSIVESVLFDGAFDGETA